MNDIVERISQLQADINRNDAFDLEETAAIITDLALIKQRIQFGLRARTDKKQVVMTERERQALMQGGEVFLPSGTVKRDF